MKPLFYIPCILAIVFAAATGTGCHTNSQPVAPPPDDAAAELRNIQAANDSMVREARQGIKTGDLILRTGTDFSSDQVKRLSTQDKTYSHGGIAVVDSGEIYVYHVEPDYHLVRDKVRKEKLDSFCDPAHNLGIGIARYNLSDAQQKTFIAYLNKQYRLQVPFDIRFDLTTDTSLYCSEMISKGLALATRNKLVISTERIKDRSKFKLIKQYFKLNEKQIVTRDVILIDHLYLNPHCTMLKQFTYLEQQ